jgi:hypothetical protein
MKTKIILEGEQYELDISEAEKQGLLRKIGRPSKFEVGDIFQSATSLPVLIVQSTYSYGAGKVTYNFAGLNGLALFSSAPGGLTYNEMLDYLQRDKYVFKKNINKEIAALIN